MNGFLKFLQDTLLYALVFMMAISYHPTVIITSRSAGLENGTLLSRYILILFVSLFAVSITQLPRFKSRFLLKSMAWLFAIFLVGLIIGGIYNNQEMMSNLRPIAIIIASILIGWTICMTLRQFTIILFVFGLTSLFSGLSQVFTNIGGFVIEDQYLVDSKNSLGAMLATADVAFLFLWKNQKNKLIRWFALACAFVGLLIIVTIRARSALLAVVVVGGIYIYNLSKNKKSTFLLFVFIALALTALILIPSSINKYLYDSLFSGTQADDVSSGRIGVYESALQFISQNILVGNVEKNFHLPWIHNYLLLNIYQYGLLFSWPILCLYFYLLIHSIKYLVRNRVGFTYIGYTIVLVPYVISMLEPTFPFGPGTVTVLNFILLGMSERSKIESSIISL